MARRLRFIGTGSGDTGCPSVHEDLDTGEVIVHGPPLDDPEDIAQLRRLGPGEVPIVVPRNLLVDWGPKDMTRDAKAIGPEAFNKLFETFEHSAWRLETRRRYASDEGTRTYAQFKATGDVTWNMDSWYCTTIRSQTAAGKKVGRVRVVDHPPTEGQRYLMINARRNASLGEDMRNLWRADADRLRLGTEDFWIFDSRLVALLCFDDADNLMDVELITEPAEVVRYSMLRDAAMHHAIPHDAFAALVAAAE
ncbi:hypothetical protein GCM10018785_37610 [Streptomyces longispororuber]|uniref:DUF6879 domain-containing protein n=1 Tax=Streptomyces longispororuber TaxID=68230 RepID=A0A918ZQD1_9ACTN|nr:DUF6879 family protein [Streptomyces longispororuber]GHE65239.1 hypothetical protein GCM10018785_37610 [Streptomyces longispororuber]